METLTLWLGFIGAWLLFAGPIYQAALELKEENQKIDHSKFESRELKARHVSVWWWLLPPLKLYLEHQRAQEARRVFMESLRTEDAEALTSFFNKARSWLYVAFGGLCIAVKETYGLTQHLGWSQLIFWIIVVAFTLGSIFNIIARLSNRQTDRRVNTN